VEFCASFLQRSGHEQRNPAEVDGRGLLRTYGIPYWSQGYFSINDLGTCLPSPGAEAGSIDLKELVDEVVRRASDFPCWFVFRTF